MSNLHLLVQVCCSNEIEPFMNSNSFQIINSNSFQLLNGLIYQTKFYSEMHLCTHSCSNHFQTSQI